MSERTLFVKLHYYTFLHVQGLCLNQACVVDVDGLTQAGTTAMLLS